ncbi:calbindin-like isoform X2 [Xyrauchen texanus]|uniref:calbindin-like isoform X2 n=1 Tax=Xyrauchen texanus TaxID=154827 RepID=UPI00224215E8|nr:calbindin-like isoform X2 [Xyrauchen texanus]
MANAYLQGVEISASQFLDIFHHYDNDGNGYIEGKELQNFIKELQQARKQAGLELTDKMKAFVEKYEQNADGKIGITELVQILPTEENFLLFFRQQLKSCAEFMEAWRNYDADHSGYIEADELKGVTMARKEFNKIFELYDQDRNGYMDENELDALLKDLCEKNNKVLEVSKIPTYKSAIMALSDGGKLYRTELALVLCAEEM